MLAFTDEYFMKKAFDEAQIAFEKGEIPVGAIIVANDQIIAKAHNLTEQLNDVTAHAEVLAITSASEFLGSKFLEDCTLYVTLEPCMMCAGALYWSRIGKIVFAAKDEKRGIGSFNCSAFHPKTKIESGVLESEASSLLKKFFEKRR